MEDVGGRRVVHDDDAAQVAAQAAQVLHIVAPMEDTGLAEEPGTERPPFIQQVGHGVRVLGQAGGEENALEELSHALQELIHMRPLQHIHLVHDTIDFHRNDEVGVVHRLEGAVHQRLVQVDDHAELAGILRLDLGQEVLDCSLGHGAILLHQQRGVVVDGEGLGVIVAQAAEEGLEDAAAPRLLGSGWGALGTFLLQRGGRLLLANLGDDGLVVHGAGGRRRGRLWCWRARSR